jgi:hypothetical protein
LASHPIFLFVFYPRRSASCRISSLVIILPPIFLFSGMATFTNQSIIVWTLEIKPFVLSLSKHERRSDTPFDKLRVNGYSLS